MPDREQQSKEKKNTEYQTILIELHRRGLRSYIDPIAEGARKHFTQAQIIDINVRHARHQLSGYDLSRAQRHLYTKHLNTELLREYEEGLYSEDLFVRIFGKHIKNCPACQQAFGFHEARRVLKKIGRLDSRRAST